MLWRFIAAVVVALFGLWPAQLDAYITQSTGCHHNGTWYADRSLVPTVEKCLTCQCQKKTLVCRLKVCPEMPMPPPRGCIVVQQRNACCPYLSCARLDAFYKIPATRRIIAYLDHYERESIDRVVNDNMLQRRSDDSEVDMYVCVKNGTVYKSGSAMSSSNLCTYCYCIGGTEKCVKPKCMLPVEGCKPIFVDSTCCPVRYDCTSKPSGKSSQEVRYRKTSNKHYLRMSQRLQRNRGCTVDKQFYVEGQKMRSDPDKPCDICFCIRGTRRCAPKKCSPALKNCIPVVPKGQCCPSSYDCGSQRAQSSRQFNLFSLLFGKEDEANSTNRIPVEYPPDRHPSVTVTHNQNILEKNDEKSILDTIREGLEIIDGNNDEVIAENIDKLAAPLTKVVTEPEISTQASTAEKKPTEVSLLDLLLGTDDETPSKVTEEVPPELKTTTAYEGLSWVDILLGPDENEKKSVKTTTGERIGTTTSYLQESTMPSIDRIDHDFEDFSGNGEIIVGDPQSSEPFENPLAEDLVRNKNSTDGKAQVVSHKQELSNNLENNDIKNDQALREVQQTVLSTTAKTTIATTKKPQTTVTPLRTTTTGRTTHSPSSKATTRPSTKTTQSTTASRPKPTRKPIELKFVPKSTYKPNDKLHKTTTARPHNTTQAATRVPPEKKKNGLLTALLDGLTDMLSAEKVLNGTQVKTPAKTNVNTTSTTPKPSKVPIAVPSSESKPMPSFKPLPTGKPTHTRINSKIANLTVTPEVIKKSSVAPNLSAFKPLPAQGIKVPISVTTSRTPTTTKEPKSVDNTNATTAKTSTITTTTTTPKPSSTTRTTTTTTTTTTTGGSTIIPPSTTPKPVEIKTNPTILEADPFDANAEPTLPPSLPNLKIIPFLPTDAVKADRNKPPYDYYHSNAPTAKIDYDQYDEGNRYPAITEPHFPIYPEIEDGSKAEYIYKFNVEGPLPPVMSSTAGKLDGSSSAAASFVKYDFVGANVEHKGFSPPTKTEGGFVPKNPLVLNDDEEQGGALPYVDGGYQVTKHLIDITTSDPARENTTKVIEITTPDPFKDVIRTEPPPDLTSLIEDKANILLQNPLQQPMKLYEDPENLSQSLIHITTAAPQFANAANDAHPPSVPFLAANVEHAMRNSSKLPTEEHKNTIASFLDLLLGGEEVLSSPFPADNAAISSSTVPPFKTLPQAAVELIPNITSTFTVTMPTTATAAPSKHLQKTTAKPNSTTINLSSPDTVSAAPFKLNANASVAAASTVSTTRTKTRTKSPVLHRNNTAAATSVATRIASTTRPKSTRPKSSSSRRQTTKASNIATTSIQKRANITTTMRHPTTTTTTQPKPKPLLRSPFDTLPFMDTSFEVKRTTERTFVVGQYADGDFLGLLHYKNSLNQFEGLEPARESFPHSTLAPSSSSSNTMPPTAAPTSVPLVQRNIEQIISAAPQSLDAPAASTPLEAQQSASNNLIDPAGVLKLAGCNIYGRMYRVGRIILELSSPCLECKCTEVGVKCGQLDC
ncbi:PREDICTED: mucin-5AC isoform X1 [Rhagoletis zephyria]|uniref:mucin-5AC isoform X1 n=1 Tax=Rhagoletis zephyria TaxID=28612 RepID=UPI0008113193|nr:PREDICTED: mucin-5AC isoform X1 [Rhagoletis zephyria]